jgi:hypothetical protein
MEFLLGAFVFFAGVVVGAGISHARIPVKKPPPNPED